MAVASQLPYTRVEKAFFKVVGERYITPGSLITLVIKLRVIPPGFSPLPAISPAELEDPDPKEGDLDALHGRKKKEKSPDGKQAPGSSSEELDDAVQPPLAHAPYFGEDHSPRWRVFLADNKSGRIAVPPFTFSTFDRALFTYDNGKVEPTCNVQTLRCTFQAPNQPGEYHFTMHLICDSYVGFDTTRDVVMKVEEMSRAEEVESEDEISEPEDDSLAGQLSALKSGGVAGAIAPASSTSARRKKKPETADDISSGSDTEGDDDDEDSSDTDTDTDTDSDGE